MAHTILLVRLVGHFVDDILPLYVFLIKLILKYRTFVLNYMQRNKEDIRYTTFHRFNAPLVA